MNAFTRRTLLAMPLLNVGVAGQQRHFRVAKRGGHWWLLDPSGNPFFSIGMNHIDSATLRYAENIDIWRTRYANNEERWIREGVARNLKRWGFNSVGWSQEVVIRQPNIHRHSRAWSLEQYRWLDMPYCHLLPFAEIHQWEVETKYPDFYSAEWEEWCDYVARDSCQRMRDDSNLIGYFYADCPTWVHKGIASWRGPIFDPAKLESQAGRDELFALASRYYQVTHDAIRRYDPNHLILGDRYEAAALLPNEVLRAAKPFVDVFSFQYFGPPAKVGPGLTNFHTRTGKPVLLADNSIPGMLTTPVGTWGSGYSEMIRAVREVTGCIGWHVCGAYLKNRSRSRGFLNERDEIDSDFAIAIRKANEETEAYVRQFADTLVGSP